MLFLCVLCSRRRASHCVGNVTAKVAVFIFQGLALCADAKEAIQKLKGWPRTDNTLFVLPLICKKKKKRNSHADTEINFYVMV